MGNIRQLFGRHQMSGEERQAQAAYDAARRELERRRQRLHEALNLGGLMEKMQEVREND